MYYSLRFYLDNGCDGIPSSEAVSIFEAISIVLKRSFSRYYLNFFEHDKSDNGIYKEYKADLRGKSQFSKTVSQMISCENALRGDLFLGAELLTSVGQCGISCELQYTRSSLTVLKIIVSKEAQIDVNRTMYVHLLHSFVHLGLAINNSFCHYSRTFSGSYAFDGGQVGLSVPFANRRRIKQAVQHRKNGYKNHLADVYWGNSICIEVLSDEEKRSIYQMLPDGLVHEFAGSLIFTMSCHCEPYSIIAHHRNRMLRSVLMKYIV